MTTSTTTLKFSGTLAEFKSYLDAMFKDSLNIEVEGIVSPADPLRLHPMYDLAAEVAHALHVPVEKLLKSLTTPGIDITAVVDEVRHGMKINAIKILRSLTDAGLKECKDVVETMIVDCV